MYLSYISLFKKTIFNHLVWIKFGCRPWSCTPWGNSYHFWYWSNWRWRPSACSSCGAASPNRRLRGNWVQQSHIMMCSWSNTRLSLPSKKILNWKLELFLLEKRAADNTQRNSPFVTINLSPIKWFSIQLTKTRFQRWQNLRTLICLCSR